MRGLLYWRLLLWLGSPTHCASFLPDARLLHLFIPSIVRLRHRALNDSFLIIPYSPVFVHSPPSHTPPPLPPPHTSLPMPINPSTLSAILSNLRQMSVVPSSHVPSEHSMLTSSLKFAFLDWSRRYGTPRKPPFTTLDYR